VYEKHRWPFELPDPVDAILFVMDQRGLSRRGLEEYLGSRSRVSEVLARKRGLSIRMIRTLHEGLGIPLEVLVREPGRAA
jgi:HTH-type transcriptional regulator/antitoxin HigA